MTYIGNILIKLSRKLFPSGRAWRMPDNGVFRELYNGLVLSEERAYNDALSILDSILPDNDNFTADDATAWERRLGLIISPDVDLEDRKKAIRRKYQHPGTQKPRQHYLYVQAELQKAGFDVYVFENRFPDGMGGYETMTPEEVALSDPFRDVQHGQIQHGQAQHGGKLLDKIVNYLEPQKDAVFDIGDNLRSTFFISSDVLGVNAVIPEERLTEFRQLVLKLKPAQTVCFPFIDTVPPNISYIEMEDESGVLLTEDGDKVLLEDSFE